MLNFASAVSQGGGVTYGSQAQEESLCRVSSLYTALSDESAKPPQLVAKAFEQAAEEIDRCFETIEFAVYSRSVDSPNLRAFAALAGAKRERE